jgi:NAD(P)-dependent dehydrogenase (short-subunit alcohol dehydrogenase family)
VHRPRQSLLYAAALGAHPYLALYSLKLDTSLFAVLPVGLLVAGVLTPPAPRAALLVGAVSTLLRNALLPMLWLQALARGLGRKQDCVIAALSARVGSIGDNRLGGWYSYRASKAALNMLLQTAAVELARRAPATKLIAFHPGTTDTPLSRPFQSGVPAARLFTPDFVAEKLLAIMDQTTADGTLSYLDWDGQTITW